MLQSMYRAMPLPYRRGTKAVPPLRQTSWVMSPSGCLKGILYQPLCSLVGGPNIRQRYAPVGPLLPAKKRITGSMGTCPGISCKLYSAPVGCLGTPGSACGPCRPTKPSTDH